MKYTEYSFHLDGKRTRLRNTAIYVDRVIVYDNEAASILQKFVARYMAQGTKLAWRMPTDKHIVDHLFRVRYSGTVKLKPFAKLFMPGRPVPTGSGMYLHDCCLYFGTKIHVVGTFEDDRLVPSMTDNSRVEMRVTDLKGFHKLLG